MHLYTLIREEEEEVHLPEEKRGERERRKGQEERIINEGISSSWEEDVMVVEKAFLEIEFALIFSPLPPSLLLLFSSPLALSNYSRSPSF